MIESLVEGHAVRRFCAMFAELAPDKPMPLAELYAPGVVFQDPFHRVEGREALQAYFGRMNANIARATFAFNDPLLGDGRAFLPWTMRLQPKRFAKEIVVDGATDLRFDGLITRQRDHFDGGAMVYENVPLLGGVIRSIKKRM